MNDALPSQWKIKSLRDVGKCVRGLTYSPDDVAESGLLVLRSSNIQNGRLAFDDNVYVNFQVDSEYMSQKGDIVICVRNGSKHLIGKSAIVPHSNLNATHGAFMTVFRSEQNNYVQHLFNSDQFYTFVSRDLGATINSINNSNLLEYRFPFPPLQEQQKIASILSAVDEVIASTTAQINKLKDLKTGMMQELLTKGIGRGGQPHTEFKDSPVGWIPKAWKVMRLKEITLQIRDGNYGADYPTASELLETGIPFLTSAVISSNQQINRKKLKYISQEKHKKLAKAHIATNDVLFTNRGANVGDVALVPPDLNDANIGPQLTFLRANIELCTPDFLYYSLQSDYFKTSLKQLDSGSAMNFFGIGTTENFILAIPPRKEQDQISAALNLAIARELACEQKFRALQKIKNGLMQDLLTGKVRVNAY